MFGKGRTYDWLSSLFSECRLALRQLRKSPGFASIAILTLALGIGANTAIFSVVNSVLLRSLPFPRESELVDISERNALFDFPNMRLSLPDIAELRSSSHSFAGIAVYQDAPRELSGAGKPERLESTEVSEDFFPVLGLHALHGRTFTSADMQAGTRSVLLSESLWRDNFGADPAAVGKTIILDAQPFTIIGVMPALSPLGFATDSKLWTALIPAKEQFTDRRYRSYAVLARLRPHASLASAQSELETISGHLSSAYPDVDKGWSMHAMSLKQYLVGDARTPLLILFSAVGFVLLIACANVSNLFLARGSARRREFAIRSAIGASRLILIRQLAIESLVVALISGACAFATAAGSLQALRMVLPSDIPRLGELHIDGSVPWFTVCTSMLAVLLSGLAPALISTRQSLNEIIKQNSTSSPNLLRQSLVVGEIALAAMLVIGATLALRSFAQIRAVDLGFRPDHVLTIRLDFPEFRFVTPKSAIAYVRQVLDNTRAVPGVSAASAGMVFPMSDESAETTFATEATMSDSQNAQQSALANRVAPDFYRTLGIPLLAGREFTSDDATGRAPVFIVNESLAKKYFGTLDVVGKRLATNFVSGGPTWGEIVGVVGNVREGNPFDSQDMSKPQVYAPFFQSSRLSGVYVVARCSADPLALVPAIQEGIWSVDRNQPITAVATLSQRISEINATPLSQTTLLAIFAGFGLLLALLGVYGVMSYLVSLQTGEIGIRMALGAVPAQLLRQVLGHCLRFAVTGVVLGIAGGLVLSRFLGSLLFAVSPADPLTYAGVSVFLLTIAIAAAYVPARRAAAVDPLVALRYE